MKRFLMVLVLALALPCMIGAQAPQAPTVSLGVLAEVKLTEVQQTSVNTLFETRATAIAAAQAQASAATAELETLLDAGAPDLARIGTLARRVRTTANQTKQIDAQFRRDVWALLTPAQRDILLARLGF